MACCRHVSANQTYRVESHQCPYGFNLLLIVKLLRADVQFDFEIEYFLMEIIWKDSGLEDVEAIELGLTSLFVRRSLSLLLLLLLWRLIWLVTSPAKPLSRVHEYSS